MKQTFLFFFLLSFVCLFFQLILNFELIAEIVSTNDIERLIDLCSIRCKIKNEKKIRE